VPPSTTSTQWGNTHLRLLNEGLLFLTLTLFPCLALMLLPLQNSYGRRIAC
jgi:hypothetical protein